MIKDWFKHPTVAYKKENKCYLEVKSSFFDEFMFSWQRIASKMYPMGEQWMIETRKTVLESMLEMNKTIRNLTTICDEITYILEELIWDCYFDDVESIAGVESIVEFWWRRISQLSWPRNIMIWMNMTTVNNY